MTALFFGLLAFSAPAHAVTNQISTVSPSSAEQGTKGLLVSFTLDTTPPPPPTNIAVSSVTIGNIAGTVSPRTEQTIVSALFDIPGNEPPGAKDLTITFPGSFTGYKGLEKGQCSVFSFRNRWSHSTDPHLAQPNRGRCRNSRAGLFDPMPSDHDPISRRHPGHQGRTVDE